MEQTNGMQNQAITSSTERNKQHMNPVMRLAGIAILGIAVAVAAAGLFGGSKASAAGTNIDCYFFNGLQWQCDITNSDGIADVELVWHSAFGDIDLWDKAYPGCPTKVTIGAWGDHVQGDMTFDVQPCKVGGDLTFKPRPSTDRSILFRLDLTLVSGTGGKALQLIAPR